MQYKSSHNGLNRRQFVSALAMGGAVPYLPSLTRSASAQPIPHRLVVFYTQHGNPLPGWRMHGGRPTDADWEYDLNPLSQNDFSTVWAPLYPHRKQLLLLDTLSNAVNIDQSGAKSHFGGPATVFTSADYAPGDVQSSGAGAPSFDQVIAKKITAAGQIKSLELGSYAHAIWQGIGSRLPVESRADRAFSRLFPGGQPPVTPGTGNPPALTRADKIAAARPSVLDFAQTQYERIAKRLSPADKAKIDDHRDMIRELELRLRPDSGGDGGGNVTPISGASCGNKPSLIQEPEKNSARNLTDMCDNWGRVITAAFACDATRVASIQLGQLKPAEFGEPGISDVHQDAAHHNPSDSPANLPRMIKYYTTHAKQFAKLLGTLASVVEPDGKTLLDHTTVIWAYECGGWVHQTGHIPVVVAGGGFRMGRYIHWGRDVDDLNPRGDNVGTGYKRYPPPISRLMVSIAQKMGAGLNQIGTKTTARGMSLVGPLDRLA